MTQAIITKFIPCTNHRGSRVKALCDCGSITLDWNHALNSEENHTKAAMALVKKLEWNGEYIMGGLPRNFGGYVFIRKS